MYEVPELPEDDQVSEEVLEEESFSRELPSARAELVSQSESQVDTSWWEAQIAERPRRKLTSTDFKDFLKESLLISLFVIGFVGISAIVVLGTIDVVRVLIYLAKLLQGS